MDRILEGDDDFSNLVNKMFVIIEMDGFGYPMLDLFHNVLNKKGKDMYEAQEKMMSMENIDKEFEEQIDNKCVVCGKPAKHMVMWGRQY